MVLLRRDAVSKDNIYKLMRFTFTFLLIASNRCITGRNINESNLSTLNDSNNNSGSSDNGEVNGSETPAAVCATCFQLLTDAAQDPVCLFQKAAGARVEMNSAAVSQHCELAAAESTLKNEKCEKRFGGCGAALSP